MELTEQEWARIARYAAVMPAISLGKSSEGTCVIVEGIGVFRPKTFLDLMESTEGSQDTGSAAPPVLFSRGCKKEN